MTAKKKYPKEWDKETILEILRDLDNYFVKKGESVAVTAIGGIVIVLQDFQPRSTNDLDMAPVSDADRLLQACDRLGINAQVVTLVSPSISTTSRASHYLQVRLLLFTASAPKISFV